MLHSSFGLISAGNPLNRNSGTSTTFGNVSSDGALTGSGTLDIFGGELMIGTDPTDASDTYTNILAFPPDITSSLTNLAGTTWTPGVILLSSSTLITLSDALTLDGEGSYFFQIPSTSLTATPSGETLTFNFVNGALPSLVFWVINGNLTLQTSGGFETLFAGTVLAQGNIVLGIGCENRGTLAAISASSSITLNSNMVRSSDAQAILDAAPNTYAVLQSNLADNKAVQINALNEFGGVYIQAGFGGVAVDSGNSINLTAENASAFVVTGSGNLELRADIGLTIVDGKSGVNIGINDSALVNIGNGSGAAAITLAAGSGGIHATTSTGGEISLQANGAASNFSLVSTADSHDLTLSLTGAHDASIILSSTGTGSDAISLQSSTGGIVVSSAANFNVGAAANIELVATGGLVETATGTIALTSTSTSAQAITLSTAFGGGGIALSAGGQGILLDAYNGSATNGGINLVGAGPGVSINAYNGSAVGIGNFSGGDLLLGTASVSRNIFLGNGVGSTSLVTRWGQTGLKMEPQPAETILSTATTETATFAAMLSRIILYGPTASAVLSLDSASNIITGLTNLIGAPQWNDGFEFSVINTTSGAGSANITVVAGTGGSLVGNGVILSATDSSSVPLSSGSAMFRIRLVATDYIVYRLS